MSLLEIDDLHVQFHTEDGVVHALNGVSLEIDHNETLAVIGESGCGKTVTALSIMRLLRSPPAEIVSGSIIYDGRDLLSLTNREINAVRGDDITFIRQDPQAAINPALKIGYQVTESLLAHRDIGKKEARQRGIAMLEKCGLADAERLMDEYPHALSGGMLQRVMIAMALITDPKLLIADEPTTALDVTIQSQIIRVLDELKHEFETSIMLITHNLPVATSLANRVAVMYAGNVVERCSVEQLLDDPAHPYTRKLLESIPDLETTGGVLPAIEGTVPDMMEPKQGCRFAPRCPEYIGEVCDNIFPELHPRSPGKRRTVACHLYTDASPVSPPWKEPANQQEDVTHE
ncbi:ABC transporter ATP-binding protein [Natrialbaceae archaeon A-CW2]